MSGPCDANSGATGDLLARVGIVLYAVENHEAATSGISAVQPYGANSVVEKLTCQEPCADCGTCSWRPSSTSAASLPNNVARTPTTADLSLSLVAVESPRLGVQSVPPSA